MTQAVQLYGGKVLIAGGKVAIHERCCCTQDYLEVITCEEPQTTVGVVRASDYAPGAVLFDGTACLAVSNVLVHEGTPIEAGLITYETCEECAKDYWDVVDCVTNDPVGVAPDGEGDPNLGYFPGDVIVDGGHCYRVTDTPRSYVEGQLFPVGMETTTDCDAPECNEWHPCITKRCSGGPSADHVVGEVTLINGVNFLDGIHIEYPGSFPEPPHDNQLDVDVPYKQDMVIGPLPCPHNSYPCGAVWTITWIPPGEGCPPGTDWPYNIGEEQ